MFNNRFFLLSDLLVIMAVYRGRRVWGKYKDTYGDPRRIRMWNLSFSYAQIFTVGLIFSQMEY